MRHRNLVTVNRLVLATVRVSICVTTHTLGGIDLEAGKQSLDLRVSGH
jgi:hypothetical protein